MNKEDVKKKIARLRESIRRHDYLYYVQSQPEISDSEYDVLMRRLKDLEGAHPELKTADSPTVRVSGGIVEKFMTVRHRQSMLSLDNTYSFDELEEWERRVRKSFVGQTIEYVVELKIDGVSANLTYEKGALTVGATRGDGENGEEVTRNIKTIRAIPLVLLGKDVPELVEVRGEIYMDKKDFAALNKEREKEDEIIFANPRNAASGSLKLLDSSLVGKRRLNFFAHSMGEYRGKEIATHWEYFEALKSWGIRVNPYSRLCRSLAEVQDFCRLWQAKRETISYEIDGIVVKVNELRQQKTLGVTLKSPRWAVAFKFPARQATTEVISINFNVGRTGVITPTAEFKPVECGGVIIKHATLHNFDEIKRLTIKVGDRVLIERAGDVIPKVVKVVQDSGKEVPSIPSACPVCDGRVIKEKEEEVAYRCINPNCPAQLERRMLHFSSRSAMDIEGMGEAVVRQLVSLKMVRHLSDIYALTIDDLLRLELVKEKKAKNLLAAIQKSKQQSLSRLVYALGIRHIGEKAAYVLAQEFKTLEHLARAEREKLESMYEVGPVIAESVVDYFSQPQTKKLLQEFKRYGLNMRETASRQRSAVLAGKTVVFTGEMDSLSRTEAEEMVRSAGGTASDSVSKRTAYVVAGKNPGSKFDTAKKLGTQILTEDEFVRLMSNTSER